MICITPSSKRHFADHGWLQARWHFSFGDYQDSQNINWSALRVFNDDVVQPGGGFPMHPHRDMEIITYVVDGELEHRDHLGNRGIIHPGEVQVMSAGKGIMHSEANASRDKPVHLMQLWLFPRSKNQPPRWEQRQFAVGDRTNTLLPVVSSGQTPGTLSIDQDAEIYVSKLEAGQKLTHTAQAGHHAYLFVISGNVTLNATHKLSQGDQARIADEPTLEFAASSDAELILLDLP